MCQLILHTLTPVPYTQTDIQHRKRFMYMSINSYYISMLISKTIIYLSGILYVN